METTRTTARADELIRELFFTPGHPDPYPLYRELRELAPIHPTQLGSYVAVSREACEKILRDTRFLAGLEMPGAMAERPMWRSAKHWLFYQDPPDHGRLRSLVTKAFTPQAIESLSGYIADFVSARLDEANDRGTFELVADLAFPLPITIVGELIGIPESDRSQFRAWSAATIAIIGNPLATGEQLQAADDATQEADGYLRALVRERRSHPRDDLATRLVHAEEQGGRLTEDELVSNLNILVMAGFETTVYTLGNSVLALLDHPDQLDLLRADTSLVPNAVEELLRYESPVLLPNFRRPAVDVEVCGVSIEAGRPIAVLPGAANRDPAHMQDPDRLDVRREQPRPLSFGAGAHFCVGAALARMEIREALQQLVTRFATIELVDETVVWARSSIFRGPSELRLALGGRA